MRRIQVDLDRVDCDPDGVGVGRSLGWGREAVETLRMRADILNSSDRVLLKMYLLGSHKSKIIHHGFFMRAQIIENPTLA